MPGFSYLLPVVGLGPPPGYTVNYSLPITSICDRLKARTATVNVIHRLCRDGAQVSSRSTTIVFDDRHPSITEWNVAIADDGHSDWASGERISYWEVDVTVEPPGEFTTNQPAPTYTLFSGPERKTFFNDNAIKFGDPVTIAQVREFGAWCSGYPCCAVDPALDADESVILINPYHRPAVVGIELAGLPTVAKVKVEPMSARRVSVAGLLGPDVRDWRGQIYVTGRSRLIVFFAKHGLADPGTMTTLEHPDLYRGEPTHEALTQRLRRWAGNLIPRS